MIMHINIPLVRSLDYLSFYYLWWLLLQDTTPSNKVAEKSLYEVIQFVCLTKTGYRTIDNNGYFKIMEATESSNVTLPCTFCGTKGDTLPRLWHWKQRFGEEEREVEIGLSPTLKENRIFILPDNSLTIQQLTTNDTGHYYCRSLMESETSEFHFSIDVVKDNISVTEWKPQDEKSWEDYSRQVITTANENLYKSNELESILDKVTFKIVSEWDPWLPCDGCEGTRKRFARCRIHTNINKGKFPDLTEENLSDSQRILLKINSVSCHSLDIAHRFPYIFNLTSVLPNFVRQESCQGTCIEEKQKKNEAKYKLDFRMEARSSMAFVCPESDMRTKVVWRKNGDILSPIGAAKPMTRKKQSKIKIPFKHKDKSEFTLKHAFVDRMNILQLCYVGQSETAIYTCYIDDILIKIFNITVVTAEETLRERRYHFWLLSIYTSLISAIIVAIVITWVILQRNNIFQHVGSTVRRLSRRFSKENLKSFAPVKPRISLRNVARKNQYDLLIDDAHNGSPVMGVHKKPSRFSKHLPSVKYTTRRSAAFRHSEDAQTKSDIAS